jgi:phosphate transport system protein
MPEGASTEATGESSVAREHFDQDLQALQASVLAMGSMVEKMIVRAVRALTLRDTGLAGQVISADSQVDALAYAIEDDAMALICMQQPVATDLRRIAAALVIVQELERMGDHAEGIAKLTRKLCKEPPIKPLIDIPRMSEICVDMLHQALQAYLERDETLARRVWEMDDHVDRLYNQVYHELLGIMTSNPETIERATNLLHVAHDLERVGDRVTNICERVVYIVTGETAYVRKAV